jgi:hypothetical protein
MACSAGAGHFYKRFVERAIARNVGIGNCPFKLPKSAPFDYAPGAWQERKSRESENGTRLANGMARGLKRWPLRSDTSAPKSNVKRIPSSEQFARFKRMQNAAREAASVHCVSFNRLAMG